MGQSAGIYDKNIKKLIKTDLMKKFKRFGKNTPSRRGSPSKNDKDLKRKGTTKKKGLSFNATPMHNTVTEFNFRGNYWFD